MDSTGGNRQRDKLKMSGVISVMLISWARLYYKWEFNNLIRGGNWIALGISKYIQCIPYVEVAVLPGEEHTLLLTPYAKYIHQRT